MDQRNELRIVAELALAGVTAAAVVGMDKLFEDGTFRGPLLFQVLLAHLSVAALRRTKLNLAMAAVVAVLASAVAIAWSQYAGTLWVVLPSPDTWTAIQADLDQAWAVFSDVRAPAPVLPGFIVVTSMAIWLVAVVADWAAFRSALSFEALLPSATLFLFAAVLSHEEGLGLGASVYAGAGLGFLLIHRVWRQEGTATWASLYRRRARRALLGTGAVLTVVAVVAGSALGPNLPGAEGRPIYDWRGDGDSDDTRVVISPLVDVRGRLVETNDVEVFTVQSDGGGSYWRTTALDEFNGEIWGSSYQTDEADGNLPQAVQSAADTQTMTQEVSMQALAEIWLPAAYNPVAIDADGAGVVFDESSSSLLVEESSDSSDNLSYVVESAIPSWTAEQLRQAPAELPDDIADRYLQLPDLDERIEAEARRIAEGSETQYDQALALQNYLRSFEYTLDVNLSHDDDAMVEFLLEEQRGYCEQFSGAFAAMARSLGIPTRVAVGFTQGVEDPNQEGLFRVRGEHAHAWPEVYFQDYGWVAFEPTPGRGPNGAEDWLGLPQQQHGEEDNELPEPPNEQDDNQTQPPPGAASEQEPGAGPEQTEANPTPSADGSGAADTPDEDAGQGFPPGWLVEGAKRVAVVLAAYLLVVPTGLALQRALRRRRARRPDQRVQLAWDETIEHAALLGLSVTPAMTLNEQAALLQSDLPAAARAIDHMTTVLERNLYAGTRPGSEEAATVQEAAGMVQAEVARQRSWPSRVFDHIDARRLLPSNRGNLRRSAHSAERSPTR
jgi:transglutaminase-like putative cysteine protease